MGTIQRLPIAGVYNLAMLHTQHSHINISGLLNAVNISLVVVLRPLQ